MVSASWIAFYGFCLAAILLWVPGGRRFWPVAAAIVVGLLVSEGAIRPLGAAVLGLTACVWLLAGHASDPRHARALRVAGSLLSLALVAHLLPGFSGLELIAPVRLSPASTIYTRWFQADKAFAGLLFLGLSGVTLASRREWPGLLRKTAPIAALTMLAVFALGLGLGRVAFSPKWSDLFFTFLLSNLFLTCIAEEVAFRGIIQTALARYLERFRHGAAMAVGTAALLFGLAHLGGGVQYAALAMVAGIGYGYAYHRTGRVEAAILAHLSLNLVHFVFFTYPSLG